MRDMSQLGSAGKAALLRQHYEFFKPLKLHYRCVCACFERIDSDQRTFWSAFLIS
jgi:hypothetical protein